MEKIKLPTTLWVGNDALSGLAEIKDKKVFIVCDPFIVDSGVIDQITAPLAGNQCHIFSDIIPDPPIDKVISGIRQMTEFGAEIIVAVGGGSAIDAAKAMKYFGSRTTGVAISCFIAVPTTSGTGSEVTNFSVITLPDSGAKFPLVTDEIQPNIAILDTNLVMSVPPKVTADTGMDVLTHVIEAYVSKNANDVADAFCEKVVKLVFTYLERAYKDGSDAEAREKMHIASCVAGMAFNLTNLGLNHGIAHAAGARLHVPHGRMNAILLPEVIEYNADLADYKNGQNYVAQRYAALNNCLGNVTNNPRMGTQSFVRAIRQLRKKLNMPATLSEYGLSNEELQAHIEEIASGALKDGTTQANPKMPTEADVIAIIKAVS